MNAHTKVVAYHDQDDAINGVQALRKAGYRDADIVVMAAHPDHYTKFESHTDLPVQGLRTPWGDILTYALLGGALLSLFVYFMEIKVIGMHTFGASAMYPLLGVLLGLCLGLLLGALIGWYVFLSKRMPENDFPKALRSRKLLFLIEPKRDALGQLSDILTRSRAETLQ